MESPGVCGIEVATRGLVGGSDTPSDLDSPSQVNSPETQFQSYLKWLHMLSLCFTRSLGSPVISSDPPGGCGCVWAGGGHLRGRAEREHLREGGQLLGPQQPRSGPWRWHQMQEGTKGIR